MKLQDILKYHMDHLQKGDQVQSLRTIKEPVDDDFDLDITAGEIGVIKSKIYHPDENGNNLPVFKIQFPRSVYWGLISELWIVKQ